MTPETSRTDPPLSTCLGKLTSFKRSISISFIGHCTNCFPELSSQILLGIACKKRHRDHLYNFFFFFNLRMFEIQILNNNNNNNNEYIIVLENKLYTKRLYIRDIVCGTKKPKVSQKSNGPIHINKENFII